MLRTRVIPCLLLQNSGLVKTIKFNKPTYIGDPINSVRIYNELGVDELIFLDIKASVKQTGPQFEIIAEIASECFMPFSYGGGIKTLGDAEKLFDLGVEKVVLNTSAFKNPELITIIAGKYGSQSVIVGIDVKKTLFGTKRVYVCDGTQKSKYMPIDYAKKVEDYGAGEILLNSVNQDGMMQGFDLELIHSVASEVSIPVIALGGCGEMADIVKAKNARASAIGLGSMSVYQNKNRGILINFPEQQELANLLEELSE